MPAGEKEGNGSQYKRGDAGGPPAGKPGVRGGRRALQELFKSGRRLSGRHITLIYSNPEAGNSRYSIFVPRRLGNAALRNRARRVLKELIRTHPHPAMEGKDIIILYRQRIDLETMNKAGEELGRLLDRLAGEQ